MIASLNVPVFRPNQDSTLDQQVQEAVSLVLSSQQFILGKQVARFEEGFADYCGVSHCVSLASGTDALELALKALGVSARDEVAVVANAGFYGSLTVRALNATPLYIEVSDETLTMCAKSLGEKISPRTKAVIITHLYGQMADMPALLEVTDRLNIPVIEDCAQAHGARLKGRLAGSWGKLGCFSFYPTKNLGCVGDGGAVVTQDEELSTVLRELRQYGWRPKYHVNRPGGRNSRLDEIQAAILSVKLPHLDSWNQQRREIAQKYVEALRNTTDLMLPNRLGEEYVAHLFVVRSRERDRLRSSLSERGIGSDIHYPVPDHLQPAYAHENRVDLSVTQETCERVLTLPCFPGMLPAEVTRVIEALIGAQE